MFTFTAWPSEIRSITQPFGVRPDFYGQFGLPGHEGIDFNAPQGTKIFSVAPGRVSMVQRIIGTTRSNPYGRHIIIEHADGYRTTYAHLSQTSVNVNQMVNAGTEIGLSGNTGNSFGAHLHLSLQKAGARQGNWPNELIDPTPFLLPLLGWQDPAGPFTAGFAFDIAITAFDGLAQVNASPASLRAQPNPDATRLAIIPAGTLMRVSGPTQNQYIPVQVPNVAIGLDTNDPTPPPATELPPGIATLDGWGFTPNLAVNGNMAVIINPGVNLRTAPQRTATNIGLVRPNSSAEVTGTPQGDYTPIRVSQNDFIGEIHLPEVAPDPTADGTILGWGSTQALTISGQQATTSRFGVNLRARPNMQASKLGMIKGNSVVTIAGQPSGIYTPIHARPEDILELISPLPTVQQPTPLPGDEPAPTPTPIPIHDTTPGWAFTAGLTVNGEQATANTVGLNLRDAPRRDATNIGFVPGSTTLIVTGARQGEYTPVRVDDTILQPPFDADAPENPEPQLMGSAKIGLHASADPAIQSAEFTTFQQLRPGIIKVLSFHSPAAISRLATAHPQASFILRAFLNFGGRNITPQQFFDDTISDVRRSLNALPGREVIIELHNETNLVLEGLGASWQDGASFGRWWLQLLQLYRTALPGRKFIYPGLSPGGDVARVRQAHIPFIQASRTAVNSADGLAIHLYWSRNFPMSQALTMLDEYIRLFPATPIWVTEASNNKGGVSASDKGRQYLQFWHELQQRPTVQGVTYFVASASNPAFAEEVWVNRTIATVVGAR